MQSSLDFLSVRDANNNKLHTVFMSCHDGVPLDDKEGLQSQQLLSAKGNSMHFERGSNGRPIVCVVSIDCITRC